MQVTWNDSVPALLSCLLFTSMTHFLWRSTFKRISDEFLSVPLSFRSVHFYCVPSPGLLACRKHSKSREWDHSASFGSVFLCILQSLSFPLSLRLSLSRLRERQLHKQALVIPTLPIPAVVPVSFHIPLLFFLDLSPSFSYMYRIICLYCLPFLLFSATSSVCQCGSPQNILYGIQNVAIQLFRHLKQLSQCNVIALYIIWISTQNKKCFIWSYLGSAPLHSLFFVLLLCVVFFQGF